jgi:hypothetical protein
MAAFHPLAAIQRRNDQCPLNAQKTKSASFLQAFHNVRNLPSPFGWTVRVLRFLLFEFQRVPRPNQSCHLKPSKADPTQSALGDVFRGQDHAIKNF